MATNTFGIVFYIKKQKSKKGKAPIYARITVDGKRVEISIKKNIEIDSWNFGKGLAKGKNEDVKVLNTYLEQIRSRLVECYQQLQLKKQLITAEGIKSIFLGVNDKEHTLLKMFDYHYSELKYSLSKGTLKNYNVTKSYVVKYLKEEFGTSDIYLSQLNYNFLIGFERSVKENLPLNPQRPCKHNTIMKHIQRIKKLVNMAIKNEWLDKDPFQKFKMSFTKSEREYLTKEELETIEEHDYSIDRLQQAKDFFVFSCYTGIAYVDTFNLSPQNVMMGIDGEYWIRTSREKTDQPVRIPLLPKAEEIIEKYKSNPVAKSKNKLFPTISNQKINLYLKEIADLCEIKKNLTFHMARHTFATTVTLTNGVPIETVSKLLGHTSIKTTQIYAKVIERKVSQDMNILRSKLAEIDLNKKKKQNFLAS